MMNKLRNRLKENKKKKLINKMMELLDLTDVGLGRAFRKYLNTINNKTRLLTKTAIIVGFIVASTPFLIMAIISGLANVNIHNFITFMSSVIFCTIFILTAIVASLSKCWYLLNNHGPIGQVIKALNNWKHFYYDMDHPFSMRRLDVLPFMDNISDDRLDALNNPKDWSDDELGQLMRLTISCAAISVNADYNPTDRTMDRFLENVKAKETLNKVLDKVMVRREARIEAEKNHEENEHSIAYAERDAKSASMADILQERLIKEHPDDNNVDFNRINDLYAKLNDKTKELRTNIVERSNQ